MNDKTRTDAVDPRELREKTLATIPDPQLRKMIFGTSQLKIRHFSTNLISLMNNAMLMAFFGIYAVWKKYMDAPERREDSLGRVSRSASNAKRVDDTMSSIYCDNILTQEVIAFILTELLLEIDGNAYSPFHHLISGKVSASKFPKVAEMIRVWKMNFQGAEQNMNSQCELYSELLDALSVLRYMTINAEEDKLVCRVEIPNGGVAEMDLSYFIRIITTDDVSEYYYLFRATISNRRVLLHYMSFNGMTLYTDEESDEFILPKSEFYKLTRNSIDRARANDIAKSLKINDFKYIHRLALCVSDVLGANTKNDLLERIKEKDIYRDSFRNKSIYDVNWDNTIVLLMLEEGPSEILEAVLKSNSDAFDEILTNVAIRFALPYKTLISEYAELEKDEQNYQELMQIDYARSNKVKTWLKNARISLMAQFIISKVAQTEAENIQDRKAFYAESIMMKLQKMDSAVERRGEFGSIVLINKMLERVLRTLIPFYEGILAYARKREKLVERYTLDERHKESVLRKVQRESEDAFFERVEYVLNKGELSIAKNEKDAGVADYNKPIKNATLGELVYMFRALCKRMDAGDGRTLKFAEEHMLLHSVIGRRQICDVSVFDRIITANKEDFTGLTDYPTDLPSFFNYFKHDKPTKELEAQDTRVIKNYIGYIRDLFEFFNMNGDFKTKGKISIQNIFDPIFPYVVRYSEKNENRDRCSVCQYIINADGGFEDKRIKLLTEYEYDMNELYYCIPNNESSTQNWWVSPFLISCRRFDEILLKKERG